MSGWDTNHSSWRTLNWKNSRSVCRFVGWFGCCHHFSTSYVFLSVFFVFLIIFHIPPASDLLFSLLLQKKMKEKEQKEAVEADRNCFDEQRCRRRKPFVFQSTMVPTPTMDPTVPTNITRSQLLPAQPEAPTATPLPPTHDHHHYHPAKNVSPQFWSVSGGESWTCHTGLPDLNATVDESGFVVMDKTPMVVVMDQRRWPDAKKLATTEARKKRIEINRRKGTSAVASHRIGASSNDRWWLDHR